MFGYVIISYTYKKCKKYIFTENSLTINLNGVILL